MDECDLYSVCSPFLDDLQGLDFDMFQTFLFENDISTPEHIEISNSQFTPFSGTQPNSVGSPVPYGCPESPQYHEPLFTTYREKLPPYLPRVVDDYNNSQLSTYEDNQSSSLTTLSSRNNSYKEEALYSCAKQQQLLQQQQFSAWEQKYTQQPDRRYSFSSTGSNSSYGSNCWSHGDITDDFISQSAAASNYSSCNYERKLINDNTYQQINSPDSTSQRRRGRRRRNQLWQFFLRILEDPECQDYIQWEDRESGTFRFVDSKKVAQLWGTHKKRSNMSFEYLSRAIRYYYQQGIMSRVCDGRRLVYKFGPNAEGWRTYATKPATTKCKT